MSQLLDRDPQVLRTDGQPELGVIEEARRRRRRRRLGTTVALAALAGSLMAVLLSGGTGAGRNALSHFRPHVAVPSHSIAPRLGHMRLSPSLQVGQAGWCVAWSSSGGGSCGALPLRDRPFFGGMLFEPSRTPPPPRSGAPFSPGAGTETVLTIPAVAAVAAGHGRPVLTHPTGLWYGYRIAVVPTASASSSSLEAFDAHGHRIRERFQASLAGATGSFWQRPERPPAGLCQLSASGLHGLTAEEGPRGLPEPLRRSTPAGRHEGCRQSRTVTGRMHGRLVLASAIAVVVTAGFLPGSGFGSSAAAISVSP